MLWQKEWVYLWSHCPGLGRLWVWDPLGRLPLCRQLQETQLRRRFRPGTLEQLVALCWQRWVGRLYPLALVRYRGRVVFRPPFQARPMRGCLGTCPPRLGSCRGRLRLDTTVSEKMTMTMR